MYVLLYSVTNKCLKKIYYIFSLINSFPFIYHFSVFVKLLSHIYHFQTKCIKKKKASLNIHILKITNDVISISILFLLKYLNYFIYITILLFIFYFFLMKKYVRLSKTIYLR